MVANEFGRDIVSGPVLDERDPGLSVNLCPLNFADELSRNLVPPVVGLEVGD